jgi:hypothetical protein
VRKALALLLAAAALGAAGTAGASSTSADASSYWYPSYAKKAFMDSCLSEYGVAYCGCSFNWLKSHVRFERLMNASDKQMNRWAAKAVGACWAVD